MRWLSVSMMAASLAWPLLLHANDAPAPAATVTQADARLQDAPLDVQARELIADPEFGEVTVYASAANPPRGLALFASGDGGWNLGVRDMAHQAAADGWWVAGFDTPKWLKHLDEANAPCSDAAGKLQALGARIVQREHLPADTPVILIGYSSGATVVYAALAQAKTDQFAGGLSLGFCPDLIIHKPFCPGANHLTAHRDPKPPHTPNFDRADHLGAPWRVLQGEIDQVCAPHFSPDFAKPLHDAKVWMLPHVGHGFGKPKNWMPQYRAALRSLPADASR
ncbi:MAG TPA: AcvB/VirJ family lysyl-phosphatidylglycerol hydrolase [Rhodanobacteraceae bacterium]|nr:AcvB/VirJ family lysyl-phosphatidylglycerol hydrolase [Rhodanobacteraceae bacterium]